MTDIERPTAHPVLMSYGRSHEMDTPIVIIFGREPNDDLPMAPVLGRYDFRAAPRCAFWNSSYSLLAALVGTSTRDLKSECEGRAASPLWYADCSTSPILDAVTRKQDERWKHVGQASEHVRTVFNAVPALDRIKMIVLSGVDAPVFSNAVAEVHIQAKRAGIPCFDLPFFYGTNAEKIRNASKSTGCAEMLTKIGRDFFAATRMQ